MSLTVKRLDFVATFGVMRSLCDQHLAAAAPNEVEPIRDVQFCINTALESIRIHKSADLFNSPPRPAQPDPAPAATQTAPSKNETGLSPLQNRVLDYIRAHPNCQRADIVANCEINNATTYTCIRRIKLAGYNITSTGRPANYRLEE